MIEKHISKPVQHTDEESGIEKVANETMNSRNNARSNAELSNFSGFYCQVTELSETYLKLFNCSTLTSSW